MSKVPKVCAECRDSEDGIWISCGWVDGNHSDYLCETCFDKLNVSGERSKVKGSQYNGEPSVPFEVFS